jgi:methyltransferase-like protein 6
MEDSSQFETFELTEEMIQEAESKLSEDTSTLSAFIYNKFEEQASKMWNIFYKHNTVNFYKDRHYLAKVFPEIGSMSVLQEVGCGVGNAIFPLLSEFPSLCAQVSDFSSEAIKLLTLSESFDPLRIKTSVCDITSSAPFTEECQGVLMLFVLSAVAPEKHREAILNASTSLTPGGFFFFRDYAKYDLAQMRFVEKKNKKLKEGFYLKTDGTRVFYFTKVDLERIFEGFTVVENEYHCRVVRNRKREKTMFRVWIQAKFVKN